MAIYESIFIVDSLVAANEIDAIVQRVSSLITNNGGTVRKVDKWGKRRLAYEIEKKQYGFYVAVEFEGETSANMPKQLEYEYNFNDKVMRHLTYRYDKNKLRAMSKEAEKAEDAKADTSTEAPVSQSVGEKTETENRETQTSEETQQDHTEQND